MRINKTPSTIFGIYHYVLGGIQQTLLDRQLEKNFVSANVLHLISFSGIITPINGL